MSTFSSSMFVVTTAVVVFGTAYSVLYNTFLDTSDPLLTHLPHPLHLTHYFASKSNFLNIYFIKQLWLWITAAFLSLFLTSPKKTRYIRRIVQFLIETGVWLVFTSWFFGPAVLERVITLTGGECVIPLPSGDVATLPFEYCYTKSTVSAETNPSLFAASLATVDPTWSGKPRLRRGHDISGHMFLLTMAILFLADQLQYSWSSLMNPSPPPTSPPKTETEEPRQEARVGWPPLHKFAVAFNLLVICVSLFSVYTTSVYFHTPIEKVTGYILGVAGFALTQLPLPFFSSPSSPVGAKPTANIKNE